MEHTGLTRQTLHLYATIGIIREKLRTPAGYRMFPPTVFADLDRVRSLKKQGKTLRDIREILDTKHATRLSTAKTTRTKKTKDNPATGKELPDPPDQG